MADTIPTEEFPPLMPFTDQVTEVLALPATVAAKLLEPPKATVATEGVTITVTAGAGDCSVTVDEAEAEAEADETALMTTVLEAGIAAGAVYTPEVVMVPREAFPPTISFTRHVTAVLVVPLTVAVNALLAANRTVAEVGEMVTVIGAAFTVTETEFPVTAPLPGCLTAKLRVPAWEAAPVTTSLVGET